MSSQFTSEWLRNSKFGKGFTKAAQEHIPTQPVMGIPISEADLHNEIMDFCRDRGWQFLHGSMAARTHRTLGEPDFIILMGNGAVLFVECKTRVGKLSVEQQAFAMHAARNGHTVHVVRSMDEFGGAVECQQVLTSGKPGCAVRVEFK